MLGIPHCVDSRPTDGSEVSASRTHFLYRLGKPWGLVWPEGLGELFKIHLPYVPPKRRFLQEPHDVTSQKTAFFIVTSARTSDLVFTLSGLEPITFRLVALYINHDALLCPHYRLQIEN
jgi:hypothetical protein